ncbi:MAG TPA: chemotaxis protein CheB [Solirubrobacteraceae bacterium]|nr:chemotaxis protein CheB [Solirubrobacteraceae bacterium]
MPPFDAVVAVGSQGALTAFRTVLACLPATLPAAVIFDLHRHTHGFVEELLARASGLPVRPAAAGLPLDPGTVYVAPCDRQLTVSDERLITVTESDAGAPGHRHADALLTSAARAFGPRLIAVVLSGRLDGGALGVRAAKRRGARVLVQDPSTAAAPAMPSAALATGCADFALRPESLGRALVALCAAPGAADLFRVRLNAGVLR